MKTFYHILSNSLIAAIVNNLVWFALTYWAYLETRSVLATSILAGVYLTTVALCGIWFGTIVDHNKKKNAMLISSFGSLVFFTLGYIIILISPDSAFKTVSSLPFWGVVITLLFGTISGNIRNITVPTVTTILVPAENRDKANGLSGTVMGISFAAAAVGSGLLLGFIGMEWLMVISIVITIISIVHLLFIPIPEKSIVHLDGAPKHFDFKGTIKVIATIPGLFALIFFTTFNNFLGGIFMSLMDAYGLSLFSLQVWGILWGFLSFGFIFGGLFIAKFGLGKNPVARLFLINIILWIVCIFFTIQESAILLIGGMIIWVSLVPFVEATEQTVIQKVVPPHRQGRVFGFAQSIEQAASPLTAFFIGPIAQFFFIPFMTTGGGVELIGEWFGTGQARGIALVFTVAGILGLMVTLFAMRLPAYELLAARYQRPEKNGTAVKETNSTK